MTKPSASNYKLLDASRGLAALWVLMGHAAYPTITTEAPGLLGNPFFAFCLMGRMGVTLFFVISGYCIAAAAESAGRKSAPILTFAKARIRRIYPPYIASTAVAAAMSAMIAVLAARHVIPVPHREFAFFGHSPLYYFAALTLTQVPFGIKPFLDPYWSLCYEAAFYVILGGSMLLLRKSRMHFLGFLNCFTCGTLVWLLVAPDTCPFPLNLWYPFGIGAAVYGVVSTPESKSLKASFWGLLALVIAFGLVHEGPSSVILPSWRAQAGLCVGFALLLIGMKGFDAVLSKNPFHRAFEQLGRISYSLYLSHFFVIPLAHQLAVRKGFLVGFGFQIVVAIAFAYGFFRLFEAPFLKRPPMHSIPDQVNVTSVNIAETRRVVSVEAE